MRAVVQRVGHARVTIKGSVSGAIGKGLLILLAIEQNDGPEDIEWLSGKLSRMRIFDDDQGLMNRSVLDEGGEVLLVSQFTLFASTKKGNRPSFSRSAGPETAEAIYERFIRQLETDLGRPIQTGRFGADMIVELANCGPVTIIIDSKNRE